MATLRKPGLKGMPRSRPDNLDRGTADDGRADLERQREGRSRKASDNASDRTSAAKRSNPLSDAT